MLHGRTVVLLLHIKESQIVMSFIKGWVGSQRAKILLNRVVGLACVRQRDSVVEVQGLTAGIRGIKNSLGLVEITESFRVSLLDRKQRGQRIQAPEFDGMCIQPFAKFLFQPWPIPQ